MNKKNLLKFGVLALFFAVIMTSTVVAGTFAKFVSVINGGARSQAAGFYVTDTTTSAQATANGTVMIAPEESQIIANQITYFAQVNTQVSVDTANAITGYGALATSFATIKSGYTTWLQTNGGMTAEQAALATRPDSLTDMFTITVSDGVNAVSGSTLAEQIAGLIRTAGTLGGSGVYVAAMNANATQAITVGLVTTVTWTTFNDLWDTYIGNLIADEILTNGHTSGIEVGLNITIQQYLGEMPSAGPQVKQNLAAYSWSEISQIAKLIAATESTQAATTLAASYNIAVGNTKTYTMTGDNAGTYSARIVDFRHDDVSSSAQSAYGATKAGITFETTSLLTTTYVINDDNENISWAECDFRTTTLPTLLSAMDSDLTSVIVAVDKTTANDCTTTPTSASVTSDSLWLMSKTEMTGESNQRKDWDTSENYGTPIAEGSQYAYYSVNNTKSARIKQKSGSNSWYWLRSPVGYRSGNSRYYFGRVIDDGTIYLNYVYGNDGVAPCFCL